MQNDDKSKENILKAVLAEYKFLTDHINLLFRQQVWFYYIAIGFMMFIMGYIITQKAYDAILIIPLFITPLLYGYVRQWNAHRIIGYYISNVIEKKIIPEIIGFRNNKAANYERYWMGWENYYIEKTSEPMFNIFRATVSAVVILFLPSFVYCTLCILSSLSPLALDMQSKIPIHCHVLILFFYVFLVIFIIKINKKLIKS